MKQNYVKQFFLRGMMFGGFGPILTSIVYLVLERTINGFSLSGSEAFIAILSTYLLAFVHAGASIFNQIEEWSPARSMLCHFGMLYVAYSLCYLLNSWIPFEPMVLLIFTVIFAVAYLVIWLTVFLCVRGTQKRLNQTLRSR